MNRLALKNVKLNSEFKKVLEEIRKCGGPESKPIKSLERMEAHWAHQGLAALCCPHKHQL